MSLSADQREAIAEALANVPDCSDLGCAVHSCEGTCRSWLAEADLVLRWLGEARRDEQERIKAAAKSELRACEGYGGLPPDPRSPEYGHWWIQLDEALERIDALGVIEGAEAT